MCNEPAAVCGSIHVCFPDAATKQRALAATARQGWNVEVGGRPLCATSPVISLGEICSFASSLDRYARAQTKVTFIPEAEGVADLVEYFNVNTLELLHERCQEMLVSHAPSAGGVRASC